MNKNETNHIAKLARLKFNDEELTNISGELSGILKWVDMLQTVDTSSVSSIKVDNTPLRTRPDTVKTGGIAEKLLKNATEPYETFFTVPKVVE